MVYLFCIQHVMLENIELPRAIPTDWSIAFEASKSPYECAYILIQDMLGIPNLSYSCTSFLLTEK